MHQKSSSRPFSYRLDHLITIAALALFATCSLEPLSIEPPLFICDRNISGPVVPNATRFGIFDTRFYSGFNACLDSLTFLLGARPAYVLWFQQIDDPFPLAMVASNAALGIKTVISLNIESLKIDSLRNDTLLREITAGRWDGTILTFAQKAASASTPLYLRFGYEMNGNWFPWGKHSADFIAAWDHAHRIFKQAGATNVEWIFSPGVLYGTMTPENDLQAYYPGDSVVDIVGLDGYNFGDYTDQWASKHYWQDFRTIFGKSLVAMQSFGKPVWITEVGCPSNARRPEWLHGLFGFMDNNPCVETMLWFNAYKVNEPDFRLEADSGSLATTRAWLAR